MISRRVLFIVPLALSVFAACAGIVACGTSDSDIVAPKPGADDAAALSEASTDAAAVDGSPSDAGLSDVVDTGAPPPSDAGGDSLCAAESKRTACVKCCETNHATGAQVFNQATQTCACQADVCATECAATACAATPKKPDTACELCIASSLMKKVDGGADDDAGPERGACTKAVKDACTASPDCVAMDQCESACPKN